MITSYVGESSRTGHRRGANHANDLVGRREGKPLWDHSVDKHGGKLELEDFKMKVLRKYKTPLQRQIGEALEIERKAWSNDILLNSKGEWNGTRVPRLRLQSEEGTIGIDDQEDEEIERDERDRIRIVRRTWMKSKQEKRNSDRDNSEVSEATSPSPRESKRRKLQEKEKEDRQQSLTGKDDNIEFILDNGETREDEDG